MRVFAFARYFPSRSQTFVFGQCAGLLDLGVDMTVFADGAEGAGPAQTGAAIASRTCYYGIPEPWWCRGAPALALLSSRAPDSPRRRHRLLDPWLGPEARSLRLLFEGATVWDAARENPPAILHAHFGPVGAMVEALRAASIVDAPLLTTFYGYDVSRTPPPVYRRLFARGDAFLVLSEAMRRRLRAMGAPAERIHVHRLGVDLARFAPLLSPPIEVGDLHLLSIARLVPKKGIADALRAVACARRRLPGIRYTIIGDGPLRGSLEALARSLGITEVVRFAGWRAESDVIAIARTAHAVLAPSVTALDGDAEGTPAAILEAQALGLPVVATRHAGIPEVVEEGVTAVLADEHDVGGIAEAILAIQDPARRAEMGLAGRALVERNHDLARLNRELYARYRELMLP